ncbi:MAG: DAK2 domain-containing protein [Solirubrobacteraceae bacterium]
MMLSRCDGPALLRALEAAGRSLERSVDEVNDLNVYPVPDGDTGTNMLHTVQSALTYARKAEPTCRAIAAAASQGALMGARGNSGVILSQIIRGMKEAFAGKDAITGEDLCAAYAAARTHAYRAVTAPAPGTILSALAEMVDAVGHGRTDPVDALRVAVEAGVAAVERTKQDNPTNRAAGVVDAGARGLWLLMDGALAAATGREVVVAGPVETAPSTSQAGPSRGVPPAARSPAPARRPADESVPRAQLPPAARPSRPGEDSPEVRTAHAEGVASWEGAYDVQYLVVNPTRTADELRADMLEFGADCVIVVGDETAVKVHVHTLEPNEIIRIGLTAGRLSDVVVEDLDAMTAEHERRTGIVVAPPAPQAELGLVAVVPGDGFAEIVRSLGATSLRGGATMNPSTEELLGAVRAAHARHVIVLPNDRNVILAAEQAAGLADTDVRVIPTRNLAQGMAALIAFDAAGESDEIGRAMQGAAARARCIEVTYATRATTVDGRPVREGEAIALVDGKLVASGGDAVAVLAEAARALEEPEVLTLYTGQDVDEGQSRAAADGLRSVHAGAEIQVVRGGQPHYPYIVAAEH